METSLNDDTALARLFAKQWREGAAAWFSLPGGATLFEPGDAADQLFFLKTGRLGAFRHDRDAMVIVSMSAATKARSRCSWA